MRIALGLEYDGSGFCGWQSQPAGCSVQDALDSGLSKIAAHDVRSQCAGRTDAGVHALAQVVHFDSNANRPLSAWVRGVNTLLARSISIQWAREVSPDFHARSKATGRAYVYIVLNRPERPGLHAGRVGWYHRPLRVDRMQAAAQALLGVHDFSAFRAAECQALSPVKELRRVGVQRIGELVMFEFSADAFLHHMVRNLVGCLLKIGDGSRDVAWLRRVLDSRDRNQAAPTFPPDGLYLTAVEYDPVWGLPVRAHRLLSEVLPGAGLESTVPAPW